jgi:hypothetical protein
MEEDSVFTRAGRKVILLTLCEGKALRDHISGRVADADDLERATRVLNTQVEWLTRHDNSGRFVAR